MVLKEFKAFKVKHLGKARAAISIMYQGI
jgi:hypothetical protein